MNCKRRAAALVLLALTLALSCSTALAAPGPAPEEAAILAELAQAEAQARVPSIPPIAGGMGLAVLLVFGAITSRKHREREEDGYDAVLESHRIGDPYRRLAGTKERRR